jgi:4,5-dihydroxyphthalate decarboxylase
VRRLISNVGDVERDYLANGGVFPIMHALAIRASLLDRDPELEGAAFDLFVKAKVMALAELDVTQALKVTLPWLQEAVERARAALGPDIWPYGLAANRKALENALRWLDEDGLLARPLDLADLVSDMEEIRA